MPLAILAATLQPFLGKEGGTADAMGAGAVGGILGNILR
jgi:hypothetical protein